MKSSSYKRASRKHVGIYWRVFKDGRPKQLVIFYEGPKVLKGDKPSRNQKSEQVPGKKPTIAQAKELRDKRLQEVRDGHHGARSEGHVCDVLDAYAVAVVAVRKNVNTRAAYGAQLARIRRTLGACKFKTVGAGELEMFLAELADEYSPNHVRQIWIRLKSVFRWAVAKEYAVSNPFDRVTAKPPKVGRTEKSPLSREETDQFLTYLRKEKPILFPLYHFWLDTGLRHGELLGCKWEHLKGDRYHVEEQLMRDGSFDAPKDESYGEVALSTVTIEALESFRQGEIERRKLTEPPRTGLIWCRPDGGHLNYRTEANILGRLLKAAGIESRTPHELRHTAATLMFSDGASVIQVQHQLRHSRPSITLDHYGHLLPKDLRPVFSVVPNAVLTPEAARLTGTDG